MFIAITERFRGTGTQSALQISYKVISVTWLSTWLKLPKGPRLLACLSFVPRQQQTEEPVVPGFDSLIRRSWESSYQVLTPPLHLYLHLNPVRAGMTKDPLDYTWSSHRAYVGKEDIPWLTIDLALSSFGKRRPGAQRKFHQFVLDGVDEGHRPEFHGLSAVDSRLLGDEPFVESNLALSDEVLSRPIAMTKLMAAVCRYYQISPNELKERTHCASRARAMAAWFARDSTGCTITELAKMVGRDLSTLSSRATKLQLRARKDPRLLAEWSAIRDEIARVKVWP